MPEVMLRMSNIIIENSKKTGLSKDINPFQLAKDIMNENVITLTIDSTVKVCIDFMKQANTRHVLVMSLEDRNNEPVFIGVISQRDILRQKLPKNKQKGKQVIDPNALKQLLGVVVTRDPITVSLDTPVPDIIELMINNRIDIVPVISGTSVAGIITTSDLLRTFNRIDKHLRQLNPELKKSTGLQEIMLECSPETAEAFSFLAQPVENIMSRNVISLKPNDHIDKAMKIMQAKKFRHLIVTDQNRPENDYIGNKLVGLISDKDILGYLPFSGRRPAWADSKFREHLFGIKPNTVDITLPVEEILTSQVEYISTSTTPLEAAITMQNLNIGCLPVVDLDRKLLGLVTSTDIIRSLLSLYPRQEKRP